MRLSSSPATRRPSDLNESWEGRETASVQGLVGTRPYLAPVGDAAELVGAGFKKSTPAGRDSGQPARERGAVPPKPT